MQYKSILSSINLKLFLICIFALLNTACQNSHYTKRNIPKENSKVLRINIKKAHLDDNHQHKDCCNLKWHAAKTWKKLENSSFSKGKYLLSGGSQLSISSFPGSAGGLLANINRWRQQLSLAPIKITELANYCDTFTTSFTSFTTVTLDATRHKTAPTNNNFLYAAIFNFNNETWFIKVTGSKKNIINHMSDIHNFLKSIKAHD
eukprot:COSAG01_NODE_740_length_13891_cov_35.573013_13_plen_204_part_00